jgi:hypothetical protein
MSFFLHPPCLSNPRWHAWIITVIVVIATTSTAVAQLVGAYADAAAVVALLATPVVQQRRTPSVARSVR